MNPIPEFLPSMLLYIFIILLLSYFTMPDTVDIFYRNIVSLVYIYSNYLFCNFIYFIAYSLLFWTSLHFHTSPYAPFAIFYCNMKVCFPICTLVPFKPYFRVDSPLLMQGPILLTKLIGLKIQIEINKIRSKCVISVPYYYS